MVSHLQLCQRALVSLICLAAVVRIQVEVTRDSTPDQLRQAYAKTIKKAASKAKEDLKKSQASLGTFSRPQRCTWPSFLGERLPHPQWSCASDLSVIPGLGPMEAVCFLRGREACPVACKVLARDVGAMQERTPARPPHAAIPQMPRPHEPFICPWDHRAQCHCDRLPQRRNGAPQPAAKHW